MNWREFPLNILNPKRHEKLREYLEAKRTDKTIKEELEKEIIELKKELI